MSKLPEMKTKENNKTFNLAKIKDLSLRRKIKKMIRKRAIENTKVRLAIHHQKVEDYTDEELEVIIRDEERKINDGLKNKTLLAVLSFFGLSFWI